MFNDKCSARSSLIVYAPWPRILNCLIKEKTEFLFTHHISHSRACIDNKFNRLTHVSCDDGWLSLISTFFTIYWMTALIAAAILHSTMCLFYKFVEYPFNLMQVLHCKVSFLSFQQALLDRLGKSAYPFKLEVGSMAPPSVQLVPAKRYNGAPIGTSYDVRVHLGKWKMDTSCPSSQVGWWIIGHLSDTVHNPHAFAMLSAVLYIDQLNIYAFSLRYVFLMFPFMHHLQLITPKNDSVAVQWFVWAFGWFIKYRQRQRLNQLLPPIHIRCRSRYGCVCRQKHWNYPINWHRTRTKIVIQQLIMAAMAVALAAIAAAQSYHVWIWKNDRTAAKIDGWILQR